MYGPGGGAWTGHFYYTADLGTTWLRVDVGQHAMSPLCVPADRLDECYGRLSSDAQSLVHVTPVGGELTATELRTDIEPERPDQMVFDAADAEHQYLLYLNQLWETADGWDTLVDPAPPTLSPAVETVLENSGVFYFGKTSALTSGTAHHLYGLLGTTLYGLAGASPGVAPYTDSIPYTAGGVCVRGVVIDG